VPEQNARNALMARSILDAATRLFDERGYTETPMRDIAVATGVTRPSLYYYFTNKEDILVALLRDLINEDGVLESVDDPAQSPSKRLENLVLRIGAQVVDQPARLRIINRNFAQVPESVRHEFSAQRRRVRAALTRTLEAAIEAGEVRSIDPELTTSIIFGAITGVPDWYRPTGASPDETVRAITSLLLDGIRVPDERRHDGTAPVVIQRMTEDLEFLRRLVSTPSAKGSKT
jgi:AcrR family transcriptional regulator